MNNEVLMQRHECEDPKEFNDILSLPEIADKFVNEIDGNIENSFDALDNSESASIPNPKLNSTMQYTMESNKEISITISESSYTELRVKLEKAEAQHARYRAEIDNLCNQIDSQTEFTLKIGAVLGNLVWRASYEPEVINRWFAEESSQNKVEEFVSIADRIIGIFFKMYEEMIPPYSTDEYQFVRGLLCTIVNMAVIPEGRQFLIENKDGKSLLKNIVLFFPRIPSPSGVPLKRYIMIILMNICINKSALCYLFELEIGQVVAHCIDKGNPEELRQIGLRLLLWITTDNDPRDSQKLDDLFKYVSIENIQRIAETSRDKTGTLAQKFLDYFHSDENIALRTIKHRYNK